MRVAIVGSRNYPNLWEVEEFVEKLSRKYPEAWIISGGAPGVDSEAEGSARARMLHVRSYRPKKRYRHYTVLLVETSRFVVTIRDKEGQSLQFKTFRDAAFYRNGLIVEDADQVVAFQHQGSRGTQDSIDRARLLGKPVHVYHPQS